jgi:divalent metal cation (Fe/Co/Zn/Cd) transporter
MDAVDPALVDQIEQVLGHTDGVRRVDSVKVRWIGHELHAEVEIAVDPASTLADAHAVAHNAEHDLLHGVHRLTGALVHAGPDEPYPAAHQALAHHRRT